MDAPREEELLVAKRFRVVRHRQKLPDGQEVVRDIVHHPGSVVILPLVEPDRVALIRNERVAVARRLIELPAGTLEPNEDPAATAHRELIEETGYRAARIERLGEWFMSPGILNERMHAFVASGLTAGPTALEAGEEIELLVVSWTEALDMIRSGEIADVKTIAALLLYRLQATG